MNRISKSVSLHVMCLCTPKGGGDEKVHKFENVLYR